MRHRSVGLQICVLLALVMLGGLFIPQQVVYAATAVQVASVEYYDEDVVVFNNDNTMIYYALDNDAAKGNWSVVAADSGKFTTIDTSWIGSGSEAGLVIKGDKVSTPTRVVIQKKTTQFSVSINYSNIDSLADTDTIATLLNIMSTAGNAAEPITYADLEWRKGDNGNWRNADTLTKAILEKYLVKGANLYFRIRAVDDCVSIYYNGDTSNPIDVNDDRIAGIVGGLCAYENKTGYTFGSQSLHGTGYPTGIYGRRFSAPVKLKVAQKAASMVYNVDGSKMNAKLKYGKEYKVTANYSDNTQGLSSWSQITSRSVTEVSLVDMVNSLSPRQKVNGNNVIFDGVTVALPAMSIQVRDYATEKSVSSAISTILLDGQRTLTKAVQDGVPDASVTQTTDDIYVYYFGNKYIMLTIPMASTSLPYEYCILKNGETFDLQHASWYSVTKSSAVKIMASKAPQDCTLYVRQKEIKSKTATTTSAAISYKLASTCVTKKIEYASVPVVTPGTITFVKGYSDAPVIKVQLNESGKTAFETTLKSVKLGTKEIGFTTSVAASADDASISIMTITLKKDELSALSLCTNRSLTITFGNGTVDKNSVKLTVQSSTASGSLTLTAVAGGTAGKTKVTTANSIGSGNSWIYEISTAAVTGLKMQDTLAADKTNTFTSGMDITITAGQYLTVYEIDSNRHIMKYKSMQITAGMIKS